MRQLQLDGAVVPEPPPGESDEFYTPRERFAEWHLEFSFTLDACATAESACVPRFYSQKQDGLAQPWSGERVWCNPPYSDIEPWVAHAHREMCEGSCELVVMLLPATKTEQPWWSRYVEPFRDRDDHLLIREWSMETRFISGRFRFGFPGDPTGESGFQPRFGCVLVIWRSAL